MAADEKPHFESPPQGGADREHGNPMGRWRAVGERRPMVGVAAALALGTVLGGIVFSRWGRLAFFVVAGYVANELWHSERRIEIDELIARLSSAREVAATRRPA
jgi:hypothetical protein